MYYEKEGLLPNDVGHVRALPPSCQAMRDQSRANVRSYTMRSRKATLPSQRRNKYDTGMLLWVPTRRQNAQPCLFATRKAHALVLPLRMRQPFHTELPLWSWRMGTTAFHPPFAARAAL